MPKKLLISTLIVIGVLTNLSANILPASAKEFVIDSQTYWTYDEAITREGLIDDRYFIITGLNPKNSTIRVVFQDEAATRWSPWTDEKDVFKDLHFFWWEKGWPELGGDFFETENPKFHAILDRVAEPGENWLLANQEVEIPVPEGTFEILNSNSLYYFVKSEMMTALSEQHVETCIADIKDKENYECIAIFGEDGDSMYYPTELDIPEETPDEILEEGPKETPTKETPTKETTSIEDTPVSIATTSAASNTRKSSPKISTSTIRVPETPVKTSEEPVEDTPKSVETPKTEDFVEVPLAATEEHSFPWWFVAFVFSGIFLILWWFVPIGRKKSKKVLTKED